jgi:hypothetical protein
MTSVGLHFMDSMTSVGSRFMDSARFFRYRRLQAFTAVRNLSYVCCWLITCYFSGLISQYFRDLSVSFLRQVAK